MLNFNIDHYKKERKPGFKSFPSVNLFIFLEMAHYISFTALRPIAAI